jgi:enoyl-CoA hydratase/carnithine racemase
MTTEIITDLSASILRVQFNRPARKNALTSSQDELTPPAVLDSYFDTGDIHGCFCHPTAAR